MQPSEALGIAAQIAVALAGFAGMVVVFRREGVHEWPDIDKFRLRLLLGNSILPLGLSMFGLLLLTVEPMPPGIWKWCSCITLVSTLLFVTAVTRIYRHLNIKDVQSQRYTRLVYYVFGAFGVLATVLQLLNVALLGVFWPFFAGIVYQLITAMAQFARMILLMPE